MVSVFTDWKSELNFPKIGTDDLSGIIKRTAGAVDLRAQEDVRLTVHFVKNQQLGAWGSVVVKALRY